LQLLFLFVYILTTDVLFSEHFLFIIRPKHFGHRFRPCKGDRQRKQQNGPMEDQESNTY